MIRKAFVVVLATTAVLLLWFAVSAEMSELSPLHGHPGAWLSNDYFCNNSLRYRLAELDGRIWWSAGYKIPASGSPQVERYFQIPSPYLRIGWEDATTPRGCVVRVYRVECSSGLPFLGALGIGSYLILGGRFVRWRRRHRGRYVGCDCDLTGNVSGVCPECGAKVSGQKPQGMS